MRTTIVLILTSLAIVISNLSAQESDVIDTIAKSFATEDASKIADQFSSTLELNILSEENIYSKAQAEQILRDFFSKNKTTSVKIVHRLNSNPNYKLAVFSLLTAKEKYRISISLSNTGERFLIKEIRIELDKQ